ncbi:hypothetical protein RUMTOR_01262 [[Ruminococcus] torques ATCC 27756]|uniref:Uncharacterized protein n=1 Tax=[Ruminococcus] torques ATCC 27756 TaxID=411460 RepID=A5KM06_9FIRM|nr:hypothetical protein RUMTOR_01262 [[Ruminococcus] torques ATCC 27756]
MRCKRSPVCKDSGHSMLSDKGDADNERGMIEKMIEE